MPEHDEPWLSEPGHDELLRKEPRPDARGSDGPGKAAPSKHTPKPPGRGRTAARWPFAVGLAAVLPALAGGLTTGPTTGTLLLAGVAFANGLALARTWPPAAAVALLVVDALANLELAWGLTLEGRRVPQLLHFLGGVLFLTVALRAWRKGRQEASAHGGRSGQGRAGT